MSVDTEGRYCPICGKDVRTAEFTRFGEFCCSEAHGEQHVKEVRARKQAESATEGRSAARRAVDQARREPGAARRQGGGCC